MGFATAHPKRLAQRALLDDGDDLLEVRREDHVLAVDVDHPGSLDGVDQFLRLGGVPRQWLFAQDVLAGLGSLDAKLTVQMVGQADVDRVEIDHAKQVFERAGRGSRPDAIGKSARLFEVAAHDANDLDARQALINLGAEFGDEAGAQDGNLDIRHGVLPWSLMR